MAYSNWGAFVYKNGERRKDREDVAVFDDHLKDYPSGARIWINLLEYRDKGKKSEDMPWHEHCHHAVLGDGPIRLCGYKSDPELWKIKNGKISQMKLPKPDYEHDEWEIDGKGKIQLDKKIWKWSFRQYNGNMIDLHLEEPDGSQWRSTCGYQYGAGYMD